MHKHTLRNYNIDKRNETHCVYIKLTLKQCWSTTFYPFPLTSFIYIYIYIPILARHFLSCYVYTFLSSIPCTACSMTTQSNFRIRIGMTENSFKTHYTQHKSSLKHSKNRIQTELSSLVWSLKDNNTPYQLTWHIIDNAQPYQAGKRSCNLCLAEKYHILTGKHLVNKKTELLNKCPHRRKFLTCNLKP